MANSPQLKTKSLAEMQGFFIGKNMSESNVRFFNTAFNFMEFCLVMNEQDIDEFCGMYECNKAEFPRSDANAYVTFTNDKAGQDIAVLVLKEDAEQPLASILGLIVHECVHIKQQIMENIGEDRPSSEFEAYLTQELSTTMIDEYFRRSKLFGKDKVLTQTNLATGETVTFQD